MKVEQAMFNLNISKRAEQFKERATAELRYNNTGKEVYSKLGGTKVVGYQH